MVLALTIMLMLSTLGMLGILGLKRYELNTGRVVLPGVRPRMRAFFRRALFWVERVLPRLLEHETRRAFLVGRAALCAGAARALLVTEEGLERGLAKLQRLTMHSPHAKGDASPFLREVVEHKKKLQEGLSEDEQ